MFRALRKSIPSSSPLPIHPCPACSVAKPPSNRALHASFTTSNLIYDSTPSTSPSFPLPPIGVEPIPDPTKPKGKARAANRILRPRKAALQLSPTAVDRIRDLLDAPTPQLIRVGVRNKGCAGMSYHLDYVEKPDRFDEIVEQDGVRVVIDSKALFSIIGSTMDWEESALGAKFVFKNPNIKDACGCGESFVV